MNTEFTADDRHRLEELYLQLSFQGQTFTGKFGANQLNPFEVLNFSTLTTIQNLFKEANTQVSILEGQTSRWKTNEANSQKLKLVKTWREFFELCEGFRLDQEARDNEAVELDKLEAELVEKIASEESKNKTLEDYKAELEKVRARRNG
jgi:uncharacterized protein (UPF0216 family)